jgi:hypothetical protein
VSVFVMEPSWVLVEGVPYTVRHFHGLWALGHLLSRLWTWISFLSEARALCAFLFP